MLRKIQIEPGFCLFAALLFLIVPVKWILAAFIAAAVHECFHIIAIYLLGGKVLGIQLGAGGAVIDANLGGKKEELLSAMAGPLGSFTLISLCHLFPRVMICAVIQGMFNLIPLYPLDGGRAVRCFFEIMVPQHADILFRWTECIAVIVLILLSAALLHCFSFHLFPFTISVIILMRIFARKRPCKRR